MTISCFFIASYLIEMIIEFLFSDVKTSTDTSKPNFRGRGRGGKSADRTSTPANARSRNTVVSSSGLFSEGAGDGTTKRLFRGYRGGNDEATTSANLRRPTYSGKREKIDPQAEKKHITEIYDLDEDFADDAPADTSSNDIFSPVILKQRESFESIFRWKIIMF